MAKSGKWTWLRSICGLRSLHLETDYEDRRVRELWAVLWSTDQPFCSREARDLLTGPFSSIIAEGIARVEAVRVSTREHLGVDDVIARRGGPIVQPKRRRGQPAKERPPRACDVGLELYAPRVAQGELTRHESALLPAFDQLIEYLADMRRSDDERYILTARANGLPAGVTPETFAQEVWVNEHAPLRGAPKTRNALRLRLYPPVRGKSARARGAVPADSVTPE